MARTSDNLKLKGGLLMAAILACSFVLVQGQAAGEQDASAKIDLAKPYRVNIMMDLFDESKVLNASLDGQQVPDQVLQAMKAGLESSRDIQFPVNVTVGEVNGVRQGVIDIGLEGTLSLNGSSSTSDMIQAQEVIQSLSTFPNKISFIITCGDDEDHDDEDHEDEDHDDEDEDHEDEDDDHDDEEHELDFEIKTHVVGGQCKPTSPETLVRVLREEHFFVELVCITGETPVEMWKEHCKEWTDGPVMNGSDCTTHSSESKSFSQGTANVTFLDEVLGATLKVSSVNEDFPEMATATDVSVLKLELDMRSMIPPSGPGMVTNGPIQTPTVMPAQPGLMNQMPGPYVGTPGRKLLQGLVAPSTTMMPNPIVDIFLQNELDGQLKFTGFEQVEQEELESALSVCS